MRRRHGLRDVRCGLGVGPHWAMLLVVGVSTSGAGQGTGKGQHELQERRELLDTSPERQNLVLEFPLAQVGHVEADHALGRPAEPPPGRRARDAEIGRECHVPGAVDEILEPVVIAPLRAGPGRHRDDHRPLAHAVQLSQGETERPPT